jgi:FMN phosphatase YigB (HAD superfamily)
MIKAVLLDLDNTLIRNPDRAFATGFLQHFERYMQETIGISRSGAIFRQAIEALSKQDRQGDTRNSDLITAMLATASDGRIDQVQAQQALTTFYSDVYPALAPCIAPIAGVADLIRRLHDAGYALVIATNPIYAHEAIKRRMQWGQLPLDETLYALITSADNMHFSKPDPAYYAEILGRVGIEPDEAIMVGDGTRNDIAPAQTIGLHTYALGEKDIHDFAREFDLQRTAVAVHTYRPEMMIPQLRGNIGALYGFLEQVQPAFWTQRPDPQEWSILQILCHLLTAEAHNERPRLQRILEEDNPFITAPPPPGPDIPTCDEDGFRIADHLKHARRQTIDLLAALQSEQWQRRARHSIFGLTTLLEMAYFTAQHDRLHLNQLCQTIGRCE